MRGEAYRRTLDRQRIDAHVTRVEVHRHRTTEQPGIRHARELVDRRMQRAAQRFDRGRTHVDRADHRERRDRKAVVAQQILQIATAHAPLSGHAHLGHERIGIAGECYLAAFTGQRGLELELFGHARRLDATDRRTAQRQRRIRARHGGVRQRHGLQVHVELHTFRQQREMTAAGKA